MEQMNLDNFDKSNVDEYFPGNIYVNGSIAAGKTRLINALRGVYYNPKTDKPDYRNRGPSVTAMQLYEGAFSLFRENGEGIPLVAWSFGGHSFFTGATAAFRDEQAIFLVVINGAHYGHGSQTLPMWNEVSLRLGARPEDILYVITGVTAVPEVLQKHDCLANAFCVSLLENSDELQRLRNVIATRVTACCQSYTNAERAKKVCFTGKPVVHVCDNVITDPLWFLRVMDAMSLLDGTGHPRVWEMLKPYIGGRYSEWLTIEGLELILRNNSQQLFHTRTPLVLPLNADGRCETCCPGRYSHMYSEFVPVTRGMCNRNGHSRVRCNRLLGDLKGLPPGNETYIPAMAVELMHILVNMGVVIPFPDTTEGTIRYYLPHLVHDLRTAKPPTENVASLVVRKHHDRHDEINGLLAQLFRKAIWTGEEIFGTDWGYQNVRFSIAGSTITVVEHKEGCIVAASPPCDIAAVFNLEDVMTAEEEHKFYSADAYQHRMRFINC